MPITLKKDVWKVKDPSSGQYRGAAILSTTLPADAANIVKTSLDEIDDGLNNSTTGIITKANEDVEAIDSQLNKATTPNKGLIPTAQSEVDAIDDELNNNTTGIISIAHAEVNVIDDELNNTDNGIIKIAQNNLSTIAQAVQSQIGQGTDKTLSVAKGFADAKAAGMMVKVSNYQPGSQLDDPATSQDASQNTGYPVYEDSNRVWVKETYTELEIPTADELKTIEAETAELHSTSTEQIGDIVDFSYGADNITFKKLLVTLPYDSSGYTGINLYRTGKNIFGGTGLLTYLSRYMPSALVDTSAGTISFAGGQSTSSPFYPIKFKENTVYCFVFTLSNTSSGTVATNLRILYTDGTTSNIEKLKIAGKQTIVKYSNGNKTVKGILKTNAGGSTILYCNESGIFEGSNDFLEYDGNSYEIDWGASVGSIYGGQVDVINGILIESIDSNGDNLATAIEHKIDANEIKTLRGYNVLWSSAGDIREIHRIDPEHRNEELDALITSKQDVLEFDSSPTPNSLNPVTSQGIYSFISTLIGNFEEDATTTINNFLSEHPEFMTTVQDNSLTSSKMSSEMKLWIRSGIVNVKDFGALGDGLTDDSQAILNAIAALPLNNGLLYFPPGVYIHGDGLSGDDGTGNDYSGSADVGRDIRLMFNGYTNLTIYGESAEIRSNDNNGECPHNAIFNFYNCKNVILKDLIINGRREERGLHLGDGNSYNRRGNIHIYGCDNIFIHNVQSINSAMDGAYIGKDNGIKTTNLKIINCNLSNAHRNGLSIGCGEHIIVENSIFDDAGTSGGTWTGINPKFGIDIEADYGVNSPNENIIVKNCRALRCVGIAAIGITVAAKNIAVDGCLVDNDIRVGAIGKNIRFINNLVRNASIVSNSGGIISGNEIIFDASSMANGMTYYAIISSANSDLLAITSNRLTCDSENMPVNVFCNYGLNIVNAGAIVVNNIFQNPLWSYGTNPIIISALRSEGNILYQKTLPNDYMVIPSL